MMVFSYLFFCYETTSKLHPQKKEGFKIRKDSEIYFNSDHM